MGIEGVGWLAVLFTQVFYIPNILKIVRTRDVQGYSLAGWFLLFLGLCCFLVYFSVRGDIVGIGANACGVTGSGLTLICIWRWRGRLTEAPRSASLEPAG